MADTERLDQDDQHTYFCKRMSEAFDGLWRARRLPASELLGLRVLELDESQGRAVVEFQARADFCNAMGVVQGGFVAAMLDDAMGIAGTAASGMTRLMLTHEFKVSFLRAAAPGLLVAEGRTVRAGRSIMFLEGTLRDQNGNLLATASTTARPIEPRPPTSSA